MDRERAEREAAFQEAEAAYRKHVAGKIVWGLIFVAAAAAIIVGGICQVGYFGYLSSNAIFWAVVLAVVFLISLRHLFWAGVFFPLAFLVMIFDKPLLLGYDLPFWPLIGGALCLTIGFHIFFSGRKHRKWYMDSRFVDGNYRGYVHVDPHFHAHYHDGRGHYGRGRGRDARTVHGVVDAADYVVDAEDGAEAAGGYDPQAEDGAAMDDSYDPQAEDGDAAGAADIGGYASEDGGYAEPGTAGFARDEGGVEDEFVRVTTSFGNEIKYINSDSLKRAELSCSFGSMDVYFDNAKVSAGGAAIIAEVSFGAINIYVPREWRVSISADKSFSNIEEKNMPMPSADKSANVIVLGSVSFSSLTVTYV
ncbi:MAG: hypothetical protein LBG82_06065 [Clostridiales Family XIII bacterium]|jgi:hypothetical protein|nr:hypothetical protein [Clostridiales Family XIII bacterium]